MDRHATSAKGWLAFSICSLAVLYGIWFIVWALLAPNYPGGEIVPLTYAAVDVVQSPADVLLAAQSLLVAIPTWLLLHRYCSTGSQWALRAAEWLVVALVAWAWIGGFSVSFGTFPAAYLLLAAVLLTPRGSTARA